MKTVFTLLLILGINGCASTGLTDHERSVRYTDYIQQQKLEKLDRITSFDFHGWTSLNNEFLIIRSSPKRRYLIELRSSCLDLKFSQSILINRSSSFSLDAGFDSISVPGFTELKCRIKSIYLLKEEQIAHIMQIGKSSQP